MAIERRKNRAAGAAQQAQAQEQPPHSAAAPTEAVQLSSLSKEAPAKVAKPAATTGGEAAPSPSPPLKSLWTAYALWLCCGWWGAHLLYLGRDMQAVMYTVSLGGCFGLGWLRDGWHLATYVALANGGATPGGDAAAANSFAQSLRRVHQSSPRAPPRHMATLLGQLLFATMLGELFPSAPEFFQPGPVPLFPSLASKGVNGNARAWLLAFATLPQTLHMAAVVLRAVGVALGAWAAGNAGMVQRAPLRPVLFFTLVAQAVSVGALSGLPSLWGVVARALGEDVSPHEELMWRRADRSWIAIVVAVLVCHAKRRWSVEALRVVATEQQRAKKAGESASGVAVVLPPELARAPRPRPLLVRLSGYMVQVWLLSLLIGAWTLNCSLSPGEAPLRVSLREAIEVVEPSLEDVWLFARSQWEAVRAQGPAQWWEELVEALELDGLERSYVMLGFDDGDSVTDAQLRRRWKKLALQFHPDKAAGVGAGAGGMAAAKMSPEERQERFVQIQLAYTKIQKARERERRSTPVPAASASTSARGRAQRA